MNSNNAIKKGYEPENHCKLVVPILSLKEAKRLLLYHPHEFYLAYTSQKYLKRYSNLIFPSAIESARATVTDFEELKSIINLCRDNGVECSVVFNIPYFPSQIGSVVELFEEALSAGARNFIVSDLAFLKIIRRIAPHARIFFSSIGGAANFYTIKFLYQQGVSRIILPFNTFPQDLLSIVKRSRNNFPMEFEVIVSGYRCIFDSSQCRVKHMNYEPNWNNGRFGDFKKAVFSRAVGWVENHRNYPLLKTGLNHLANKKGTLCTGRYQIVDKTGAFISENFRSSRFLRFQPHILNFIDSCGLCSFWFLHKNNIDLYKISGRISNTDYKIEKIKLIKAALVMSYESSSEEEYRQKAKKIFANQYRIKDCKPYCIYSG